MATLERIRSKAGIAVAILIGLALLGFILQDLFDSRKSLFRNKNNDVGKIAGVKIPLERYQATENELTENYKLISNQPNIDERTSEQIREQAWQQIISEEVMDKELKKLGLTVCSEELTEFFLGANPHPYIRQMFTDPQTGQFSRAAVQQFLNRTGDDKPIDPNNERLVKERQIRLYLEKEFIKQRLNTKYNNLISKGLSAPKFLAKDEMINNEKKVDFNFIEQRYSLVSDSAIKVSASDLEKYYKEHKYLYEQEASRDIEFVSFDINPSDADREAAQKEIDRIKPEFVAATDVEDFTRSYNTYVDKNYNQSDLPDSVGNFMFKAKVGDVYGPYFENETYKLARLYKIVNLPDSVKARHILLSVREGSDPEKAKKSADSLKILIEKGADFDKLAKEYSDDKSNSDKGGDLGWFKEGMMVKPFNDAAFEAKKKEVTVVQTQFGYHVLQVTDRAKETKKVKVAFIEVKLEPSKTTFDRIYAAAMKFASENRTYSQFSAAANKQNLIKRPANNISENARSIEGLENSRQVVKWAFNAKLDEVSEPFSVGTDKYVIAALRGVRLKGIAPLEQVSSQVEFEVKKLKKAEMLAEKINKAKNGVASIQDLAIKLGTPTETAVDQNFNSSSLSTGQEPKVLAIASNLAKDKLSNPIDGNNGVYVVYVTNIVNPKPTNDYTEYIQRLNSSFMAKAYDSYQALVKAAKVEDNRSAFN